MSLSVGSLFTGVGGFDLGLEYAGYDVAWQVEADKWCRQVLRARWPDVNLYGDVQGVGPDLDDVDLICGGFPCQDVSVAGRRAGLAGERSGLFFEFVRIAREVAPRWILVENVPGLLSSNGGDDFAVVLAELTGFWPATPDDGWRDAGCCEGPRGRAFWRVLDTQHFGPPQRRRRVFVVCDSLARCGPEILLEPSCVPGHPPARREAGEGTAGESARCLERTCGDWSRADGFNVVGTLPSRAEAGGSPGTDGACDGHVTAFNWQSGGDVRQNPQESRTDALHKSQTPAVYPTLRENWRNNSNPATEARMLVSETGRGWWTPGPARLRGQPGGMPQNVVTGKQSESADDQGGECAEPGRVDSPSSREPGSIPGPVAIPRRLTPRECERLQGFPDDWTASGIDADGETVEISDTQRYKQLGNAVSVPVAAWIGSRIVAAQMGAVDEC